MRPVARDQSPDSGIGCCADSPGRGNREKGLPIRDWERERCELCLA